MSMLARMKNLEAEDARRRKMSGKEKLKAEIVTGIQDEKR